VLRDPGLAHRSEHPERTRYYSDVARRPTPRCGAGRSRGPSPLGIAAIAALAVLPAPRARSDARAAGPVPLFPLRAVWEQSFGTPVAHPPAHDDQRIYLALKDGRLAAVSADGGTLAWTTSAPADTSPAVDRTGVYVGTGEQLLALDPATGRLQWQAPLAAPLAAPPAAAGGWLLTALANGEIVAWRAATGEMLWRRPLGATARVTPLVAGDRVFVGLADQRVASLALLDGSPGWSCPVEGEPTGLAEADGLVYAGTTGHFFYAIDARDGRTAWRWRIGAAVIGAPPVDARHVYVAALDNQVRALDRRHGAQRWKRALPARPLGSPLVVGDSVVPSALAAELRGLNVRDGAGTGRHPLDREVALPLAGVPLPLARGGDLIAAILADGTVVGLQRRVEPPVAPLVEVPGTPVPLAPPPVTPGSAPRLSPPETR
jgi:outer membrane protein assembly factor BamB